MKEYHRLLNKVLNEGSFRQDRTGTGAYSIFGEQSRYDLSEGFPLVTTKKIHFKSVIIELLWFLSGSTNIQFLKENGVKIWDEWADKDGNLGPVYGRQWRRWDNWQHACSSPMDPAWIDQITQLVEGLKNDPYSRRHIVTAWNPSDIPDMALPPCHCLFQFFVDKGKLSCHLYQRSADVFLGVPFNIASYAAFIMMLAQVAGLHPGEFVHSFGDLHLYANHVEQAKEQLSRDCRPLPKLYLGLNIKSIFDFKWEDFFLYGYNPHPAIKASVAV